MSANWWEETAGFVHKSYVVLDEEARCPDCGGRVSCESDCPGYPRGTYPDGHERLMVCSPPCGNADLFACLGEGEREGCGWEVRTPNRRPSARGTKPDWLDRQGLNGLRPDDDPSEWEPVSGAVDVNEDDGDNSIA